MSCTTARSACSRWLTTEPSTDCPSASWNTTRPKTTSAASWANFKARLDERDLTVRGITTDGSELYPKPLHELWPDVPHQVCEFHVLKEITKAVLHALATTRKELRDRIPKRPRGRPPKAERAQSRKAARQQEQVSKLFEHRYLFVRHRLTADQKKTLQRITRGLAHLRRLRQIMEEVYRLFDRRCRTETALARLTQLRRCVSRFKRLGRALNNLSSPNLEKALTFLDDKLLPATSNAVERSNRRYRKAQRSIYSVRTAEHIGQRIALDMQRDQQAPIAPDHEGPTSGSFWNGKTPTMMLQSQ